MADLGQWLDPRRGAGPATRGSAAELAGVVGPSARRSDAMVPHQLSDSRPNLVTPSWRTLDRMPAAGGPSAPGSPVAPGGPAVPGSPIAMSGPFLAVGAPAGVEALILPSAPTLLCDAADRVVRVNAALLRMAGQDPRQPGAGERIVGLPLAQLLVGPDGDARLVRPDGALARVRVVRWTLPASPVEFGALAGLRAVMLVDTADLPPAVTSRDDTDTERQLAELRALARVGNWSYDLRTGSLHRAASLLELYREVGIVPDAQPSGPIELEQVALLCAALREKAQQAQKVPAPGEPDPRVDAHHIEHRTAPPAERVLSCRARVERNADGAPIRLVGTVQDITDLRQSEQRTGRATQRYLDLVSISPVGVAVFNRAGLLVDANGALCALLGVPGDKLRGVPARALAADPEAAASSAASASSVPAGDGTELAFLRTVRPGARYGYRVPQCAVRRADGTSVWCELSVTVSIGDDGRPFWLVIFTDISERRRAADVLRIAGTHDELTRLPNRSSISARIGRLLDGPDRNKLAVLCCDLDDFKRVNTALGHAAGDQVLIMLAARLQRELPVGCTAARLSGDEFVVVCDDVAAVGGIPKLADAVSSLLHQAVRVDGQPVRVSAAIGVATPLDGDNIGEVGGVSTAEDLLRFADAAMYDAKRRGAGHIGYVTAETATSADHQLRLEDELRLAIAADQLELHYQPVVDPDGAVRSAEALIRWSHPERGLLFPGEFIPVAERGGLMREMDKWVLRTATKEAASWPAHLRRPVGVAVNLAGLLPGDPDFLPAVRAALAASGLAGDRLVLELVETSLVALPKPTLAAMSELAGQGVRFAVDDFGTGYSSLSRIKELPAQIVKVDRTFVRDISTDPADFAVARAVVQMAAAMGRYCVAEGVETTEQFHVLRELGVDAYQGWLFAKALPPAVFRELLEGPGLSVPTAEPIPVPDVMATQALPAESVRGAGNTGPLPVPGAEPVSDVEPTAVIAPPAAESTGGRRRAVPDQPLPDAFSTPIGDLLASLMSRDAVEPGAPTGSSDALGGSRRAHGREIDELLDPGHRAPLDPLPPPGLPGREP